MPRGGARPNSGPRKDRGPDGEFGSSIARADFEEERARHERIKADQREFKLAQERGEYLPREAYRQAAATVIAMLTQALQSLPDNLERACSLTPEQAEMAQKQVDTALHDLSVGMRGMAGGE